MRAVLVIALLSVLMGCSSDSQTYRAADDHILCDHVTREAFLIKRAAGDLSVVKRNKRFDPLCANNPK